MGIGKTVSKMLAIQEKAKLCILDVNDVSFFCIPINELWPVQVWALVKKKDNILKIVCPHPFCSLSTEQHKVIRKQASCSSFKVQESHRFPRREDIRIILDELLQAFF